MSFATLERAVLAQIKVQTGRRSLRMKDLLEWSSSEAEVRKNAKPDEEDVIHVEGGLNLWAAIPKAKQKKKEEDPCE